MAFFWLPTYLWLTFWKAFLFMKCGSDESLWTGTESSKGTHRRTDRHRGTISKIFIQIIFIFSGSMAFWFVGFALAFGEGSPIVGFTHWFVIDLSFRQYSVIFFQVSVSLWLLCTLPEKSLILFRHYLTIFRGVRGVKWSEKLQWIWIWWYFALKFN